MARPSILNPKMARDICSRIAAGESLRSICSDEDMPDKSSVMLWVATDRDGFSDQYEKACLARAHFWADELLDIADDGSNDWMERTDKEGESIGWQVNGDAIQRSRLRVDARKWLLSKMLPKFADKQQIDHTTQGDKLPTPVFNFVGVNEDSD